MPPETAMERNDRFGLERRLMEARRRKYRSSALLASSPPVSPTTTTTWRKFIYLRMNSFKEGKFKWFTIDLSSSSSSSHHRNSKRKSMHQCRTHPFGPFEKTNLPVIAQINDPNADPAYWDLSYNGFVAIGSCIYCIRDDSRPIKVCENEEDEKYYNITSILRFDTSCPQAGWSQRSYGSSTETSYECLRRSVVLDGKIYLLCARVFKDDPELKNSIPWAQVFDPSTGAWTPLPTLPHYDKRPSGERIGYAILEADKLILAYFPYSILYSSVYAYNVSTKSWDVYHDSDFFHYNNYIHATVGGATVADRTLYWFTDENNISAYDLDSKSWFFSDVKDYCEVVLHERYKDERPLLFHLGGDNFCLVLKDNYAHKVSGSCFTCIRCIRLHLSKHIDSSGGHGFLETRFESVQSYFLPGPAQMSLVDACACDGILGVKEK